MVMGEGWLKEFGCLGTTLAAVVIILFGFVAWPVIEDGQAREARALADAENARAAAVAAQAQARVDEAKVEADRDVQMQLDRYEQRIKELELENRHFQERLTFFALAISNMDKKDVSTLERWLGMNGTSPAAIVAAACLAFVAFLLLAWLLLMAQRYVNRKAAEL